MRGANGSAAALAARCKKLLRFIVSPRASAQATRVHADGYTILDATGARVGKEAHMNPQATPENPVGSRKRSAVPGRVLINRAMRGVLAVRPRTTGQPAHRHPPLAVDTWALKTWALKT